MTNDKRSRVAGWCAIASAIATILGLVTLLVFYSLGQPWGTINDLTSMLLALSTVPVLLALFRLHRRRAAVISLAALIMGGLALLVAFVFQSLLVLKIIEYEATAVTVPAAFGVFGGALLAHSYLGLRARSLPGVLGWLGIIAGAGYMLVIAGILVGGQESLLTITGGLLAVVCYPIWAIWLGRLLLSGRVTTQRAF